MRPRGYGVAPGTSYGVPPRAPAWPVRLPQPLPTPEVRQLPYPEGWNLFWESLLGVADFEPPADFELTASNIL